MIPKLIIQTGPPAIPLLLRSAIAGVRLLHPAFEYRFFTDADIESFLREVFPQYEKVYHSFPYRIQRYDFFRYLAVYHYGGFYLDLDIFLARDLEPLLSSECVFPFEELTAVPYFWDEFRMDWQLGNYAFGAAPKHPFLGAIIESCLEAAADCSWVAPMLRSTPRHLRPDYHVLNTTGPGLVSRTYAENQQLVGSIDILFPEDVRDPRTWHHFGSYGVHHMAGSWRGPNTLLGRYMTRAWDAWCLRRIQATGSSRGGSRSKELPCRT